jgi:hypothetical protein
MTLGEWQYCRRRQKAAGQGFRPLLKESHHSYTRRSGDEEKTHPKPSGDIKPAPHTLDQPQLPLLSPLRAVNICLHLKATIAHSTSVTTEKPTKDTGEDSRTTTDTTRLAFWFVYYRYVNIIVSMQ